LYRNVRRYFAAAVGCATALLEAEALAEMGGVEGLAARIALAINSDSMSTWASWPSHLLRRPLKTSLKRCGTYTTPRRRR
jgi:hypothetical protein